jgi:diguanylate cyclase (GGDEF)-like protein
VSGTTLSALARLAERRFASFSEAADTVLDALEAELPAGSVLLGEVDWNEGRYRLIDVRGEVAAEVGPGDSLSLAATRNGEGLLGAEVLSRLSVRSYLAVPLETNASGGAITLCALASATNLFNRTHLELLAVAGRLLAYEWETIRWRADLRRMAERLRDPERTDALTGLLNRTAFAEALEHEWRLAERGSTESYLVLCRIANLADVTGRLGEPVSELLLKHTAEVMEEAIRRSDHAGRLAEDLFGAVLVGCKGPAGAEAFFERFSDALARVTRERPANLELAYALVALGEVDSPEAALEHVEKAARSAEVAVRGGAA